MDANIFLIILLIPLENTSMGYYNKNRKYPHPVFWRKDIMEQTDKLEELNQPECHCRFKSTPRDEKQLRQLQNRLNRMIGQLGGIKKMLEDNRYCGDILVQVAAVESALQSFGYLVLQDHFETCVVEEIQKGHLHVVDEAVELIKKLK